MEQMLCPKCHGLMRQYERAGVTVDQCTECRGIFLDRGELERLVDAENAWHGAGAARQPQAAPPPPPPPQQYHGRPAAGYRDYDSDEYPRYGHGGYGQRKKKRGFLGELFD